MSTWQPWQPITPPLSAAPLPSLTPAVLAELLDGGQAFRWQRLPDHVFEGGWSEHHVRLRLNAAGTLEFTAPAALTPAQTATTATALHRYLAGPPSDIDALPWRSDSHLAACLAAFPGLTILRQPFGETLLGFLCSTTKQIVQIKQMMALLATRHGHPLAPSTSAAPVTSTASADSTASAPKPPGPQPHRQSMIDDGVVWRRLPSWEELASVSEEQLRGCALGFRARHVAAIARHLAENPGWLAATEHAPYPEARERLMTLPGVGEKVADCVLLFGAGRLEAFPVDTWIIKAMARRYGLDDWKPAQIAHFGRQHFGAQAGLAQQYLFAYERAATRPSG